MADITKALHRMGRKYEEILGLRRLLTDAAEKIDHLIAENQRLRDVLGHIINMIDECHESLDQEGE